MEPKIATEEFMAKAPGIRSEISVNSSGITLALAGAFDLTSSSALLDYFVALVESLEAGKMLLVDLGGVTYLPSTGVGAISTALIRAKKNEVALTIKNVPESVAKVIKLLGIWDFLHVE
jgi:anti-anti-sigma factor